MPPKGPLKEEQIAAIRAWIDQGAEWPDALANEADLPPINQNAVALVEHFLTCFSTDSCNKTAPLW